MRLQSTAKLLPLGLQPSEHRVRRARAQVGADAFNGRAFAGGDELIGRGMHIGFGDSSGHELPPVSAPYSLDPILAISDSYRQYVPYCVAYTT